MAHQAHAIPWHALADNLKYLHCSPRNHGVTNLYLRKTKAQKQVKELRHFVRGFVRALEDYVSVERKKYNETPVAPEEDEILIPDDRVRRIARTALLQKGSATVGSIAVSHSLDDITSCPLDSILSPYERSTKRFMRDTETNEGDMFSEAREACELTKNMLMYGEMDALFRLAAHPQVRFYRLWHEDHYANSHGFGLYKLVQAALKAYICLNIITIKPELWDTASRDALIATIAAYQHMLLDCTGMPYGYMCDAHTYPHREFFGIPRGVFRFEYDDTRYGRWQKQHLGTQSIPELAHDSFRNIHIPSKRDIPVVINLLGKKGLPAELALQIMELAEYVPVGRLPVRDDPFHKDNADELKQYLGYCWKLLVRMDMLSKAGVHGRKLDWEAEVMDALYALFDMPCKTVFQTVESWHEDWDFSNRMRKRVFAMDEPSK
ncbi:hypothetical protein BU23DRAFT_452997 [Bimuria novae-zelandiae CBS 107.79]|uniref:Uncharacterized protein n=1 Tax=Bimuria novae-zelandiae CBS 107.79 TaxID=1447943 RepID=A0A6A5VPF5_9PLEO|nr:hypothetical protein BU23DRAFT_452997 [Bimuria novae-zelandiae CBS 107.79]